MTVQIHRAQFVREGSASSSGGEVRYYEGEASVERLRDDVLYAFLNQVVDNTRGTSLARTWLGERVYPRLSKVVKVQRLVDGEWVELDVDLVLPDVVLTEKAVPKRPDRTDGSPAPTIWDADQGENVPMVPKVEAARG